MNRLPLCARIGALHGIIVGFLFSLSRIQTGFVVLATHQFAWSLFFLALLALLCSLFILVMAERYQAGAVFWPAAINAFLVTLLTMLAISIMPPHRFFLLLGLWIGIVVGIVVGLPLCRLCSYRVATTAKGGASRGR